MAEVGTPITRETQVVYRGIPCDESEFSLGSLQD